MRNSSIVLLARTTARPIAIPSETPTPSSAIIGSRRGMASVSLAEAVGEERADRAARLLLVGAAAAQGQRRALTGGEQKDAQDALGVDLLAAAVDQHHL